jgi:mono/diheme cytochrome c family protein
MPTRLFGFAVSRKPLTLGIALATVCGAALADSAGTVGLKAFPQRDGRALYAAICQGCHMPDAKGAVGAGAYPALAADPRLASAGYPIYMVLYGRNAMPGFGGLLDDAQVAAVVDYVRTHFSNDYKDAVSPAEVKALRQPGYLYFSLD